MHPSYDLLIGIDWATRAHQICVLTPAGDVLEEKAVDHSAGAVHGFLETLLRRVGGRAERIAVAIEIPRGALVETLLGEGCTSTR